MKGNTRTKEIRGQMKRATRKFDAILPIQARGRRGKHWCKVLIKWRDIWQHHRDKL